MAAMSGRAMIKVVESAESNGPKIKNPASKAGDWALLFGSVFYFFFATFFLAFLAGFFFISPQQPQHFFMIHLEINELKKDFTLNGPVPS